jgi:hypothetical protein
VCFDNLSRLPEDLADAACRLATGGGFGGRQLYSDHDEAIFDATRPLVFNAIPDLGTARPDFLDRALIVEFLSMNTEVSCWDRIGYAWQMDGTASFANREIVRALRASRRKAFFRCRRTCE